MEEKWGNFFVFSLIKNTFRLRKQSFIMEGYMKNLKEFRPLIKLIGNDKKKLIIASILIFISGIATIYTGQLKGAAVEAITNLQVKNALIFLGI